MLGPLERMAARDDVPLSVAASCIRCSSSLREILLTSLRTPSNTGGEATNVTALAEIIKYATIVVSGHTADSCGISVCTEILLFPAL